MQNKRNLILVISIAFSTLLFFVLGLQHCIYNDAYIPPDSFSYMESANMLYINLMVHPIRPLGFAAILGFPNLFLHSVHTDQYVAFGILVNWFVWLGTVVLLFQTLKLVMGPKASFWTTLIYVFTLGSVMINYLALTESVTTLLLLLLTYFVIRFMQTKKWGMLFSAIGFLNLAILVRPGFYYLGILLTMILIILAAYRRQLRSILNVPFLLSLVLIAVQMTAMYRTYGKATPSFIDKTTWYFYLGAEAQAAYTGITLREERAARSEMLEGKSWKEISDVSTKDMVRQLTDNKKNLFVQYMKNEAQNTVGASYAIWKSRLFTGSGIRKVIAEVLTIISRLQNVFYVLMVLASLWLFVIHFRKLNPAVLLLLMVPLYIILTSGVSFGQGDRFNLVFFPLILIVFAYLGSFVPRLKDWFTE